MITPLCFITEKNGGVLLTNNGKKLMVKALNDKLNTSITVGNEQKKYLTIIRDEIQRLVYDVDNLKKHNSFRQLR